MWCVVWFGGVVRRVLRSGVLWCGVIEQVWGSCGDCGGVVVCSDGFAVAVVMWCSVRGML